MVITIVGTGFVGLVTSGVFAAHGHRVYGVDIDKDKIEALKQGKVPFFEPGLDELIQKGLDSGSLRFTTAFDESVPDSDLVIIAVGTPSNGDGTANLEYVYGAVKSAAPYLKERAILAIKSTVPPGTNGSVAEIAQAHSSAEFAIVSLPEFLREGTAVQDTMHPDRIVIGATDDWAVEILKLLHEPLSQNIAVVSPASAQMIKYSANAYLALRISFINQIADLCEKTGANIEDVIRGIGYDKRIGSHYWYPGLGYGGSCFPKDVKELAAYARHVGVKHNLFGFINDYNEDRIIDKMDDFDHAIGGFKDKTVAVLGLSFKPNTTDLRVAPSLSVIPYLRDRRAIIKAYDPKAMPESKRVFDKLFFGNNLEETLQGADVVLLLTEWDEFKAMEIKEVAHLLRPNAWIVDTRNIFDKNKIIEAGFNYIGIGNP